MCDILSCKNVCEGVLIRDEEGKLIPVYARDVIWACGGIGGIYDNSTNFPHLTGDALAIAIHRNVALKKCQLRTDSSNNAVFPKERPPFSDFRICPRRGRCFAR